LGCGALHDSFGQMEERHFEGKGDSIMAEWDIGHPSNPIAFRHQILAVLDDCESDPLYPGNLDKFIDHT
jgi:hypothetical protein